jgi:hypothetical protein
MKVTLGARKEKRRTLSYRFRIKKAQLSMRRAVLTNNKTKIKIPPIN